MSASAAVCTALAPFAALAAERKADIEGVADRALRQEIERAVGEERTAPDNRLEARRRARDAADSATALLRSEGYYESTVTPDIGAGDKPAPVLRVEVGPRFSFRDPAIDWSGPPPSDTAQAAARDAIKLPSGQPGRAVEVLAAEGRIVAALQGQGYADAVAQPRDVVVDHADHSVRPAFKIAAGALIRLDGLRLENSGRTRPDWIRRLAPWKQGDIYKPDQVAELERRLLDTQVYDQVTVALAPAADAQGLRPVVVSLADRSRRALDLSAGYSTTEGGDLEARYSLFNRLGRADTLSFEARYADLGSRLGVDLSLPHWGHPGRTLKLTAEAFHDTTDAYDQTGLALRADLTHRYGRTSYFTRGLALVKSRVDDKHTGILDLIAVKGLLAVLLDRSDNPLDPTRGWKFEGRVEPTVITGEEGLIYTRAQAQASVYQSLDRMAVTVAAFRLRLGSIVGGKIPSVPAFDRFYAGGGGSVRGYGYQDVGPRYSDNVPQGGLSLFESSFELRRRIAGALGGVAFVDAGSVGEAANPTFSHISYGAGVGLRYNLGFAPVRADFAIPINRRPGDSKFQIYISIGQSF